MQPTRLLSSSSSAAAAVAGLMLAFPLAPSARADDWIVGDVISITSGVSAGDHATFATGDPNDLLFATTFVDYGKYTGGGAFAFEDLSAIQDPLFPFAVNVDKVDSYGAFAGTPFAYADPLANSSWISVAADPGPDGAGPTPLGTFTGEPLRLGGAFPDTFAYTTVFNVDKDGYYVLDGKFLSDDALTGAALNYDFGTGARDADLLTSNPADTYRTPGSLASAFDLKAGDNLLTFFVANAGNDRTGLDYSARLTLLPEPGPVAFGVVLTGSLLWLIGRARRRTRTSS